MGTQQQQKKASAYMSITCHFSVRPCDLIRQSKCRHHLPHCEFAASLYEG